MSNRFAAGLKEIKRESGKAAPAETATINTPGNSQVPPSRKGKVIISAYFDPAVRQQFAILAIKQNRTQSALLAEAINHLFERYDEPPIAKA